ncbi:MAG: DNA topoisomerase, partial [Candidatus Weimeria sp.]
MKKIIVTEKPSVAMEFVRALGISGSRENGYVESDEWIVTWCVGHLIEMSYPGRYDKALEKWDIDTLPFLPEKYMYEPIEDVKEQFYTIQKLYNRPDISTIYYAGDPAREGIYIQMLVRQEAGHNPDAKELVVWIDSQTKEEILRGIREAKPLSEYRLLAESGYMRAIEDYAFGINFTRLLTIRYGGMLNAAAGNGRKGPLAVGRVMTCVLGMVVKREREIRDFKATPYFKIKADMTAPAGNVSLLWKVNPRSTKNNSPELYNDTGFKEKPKAEAFINGLPDTLMAASVDVTNEKKSAPLLYNLAELQANCSRKLKLSPNETLNVAQSLYEKKLTTYPRTEAKVLSTAITKVIENNLRGVADLDEYHDTANHIIDSGEHLHIADTRYTDDSKIEDHYALIPTGNTDALGDLNNTERAVYDMIVRRFLAIFMPAAGYKKAKVTAVTETEMFTTTVSSLEDPGYLALYDKTSGGVDDEDKTGNTMEAVLSIVKGEKYPSRYSTIDKETQPPKRYTSGSMVLAMENAGNLIEDEELREQIKTNGIGTSATRAATIEKLVNGEYIALNKKTQVLTPTPYGDMVYEVVNLTMPDLLSPKMTASWEKGLDGIVTGKVTQQAYRNKLENYIRSKCNELKEKDQTKEVADSIRPYAKEKDFEALAARPAKEKYTGTYKPTGEEISFNVEWGGHRFTDEEITKLLDGSIIKIV